MFNHYRTYYHVFNRFSIIGSLSHVWCPLITTLGHTSLCVNPSMQNQSKRAWGVRSGCPCPLPSQGSTGSLRGTLGTVCWSVAGGEAYTSSPPGGGPGKGGPEGAGWGWRGGCLLQVEGGEAGAGPLPSQGDPPPTAHLGLGSEPPVLGFTSPEACRSARQPSPAPRPSAGHLACVACLMGIEFRSWGYVGRRIGNGQLIG